MSYCYFLAYGIYCKISACNIDNKSATINKCYVDYFGIGNDTVVLNHISLLLYMNPEPSAVLLSFWEGFRKFAGRGTDVVICTRALIFECLIEGEIRISIGAGSGLFQSMCIYEVKEQDFVALDSFYLPMPQL